MNERLSLTEVTGVLKKGNMLRVSEKSKQTLHQHILYKKKNYECIENNNEYKIL